jgi:tetratricopeptide (TPR) repeat protein
VGIVSEVNQEPISEKSSESSVPKLTSVRNLLTTSGDSQGAQINDSQGPVIFGSHPVVNISLGKQADKAASKTVLMLPAMPESRDAQAWRKDMTAIRKALRNCQTVQLEDGSDIEGISGLTEELTRINPYILHITGIEDNRIDGFTFKENNQFGQEENWLINLFDLYETVINCVLLNGFNSENQAREIAQYIEFVITISKDLQESYIGVFLASFYYQMSSGKSIEKSYFIACQCLKGEDKSINLPFLFKKSDELNRRKFEQDAENRLKEIEGEPKSVENLEEKATLLTSLRRTEEVEEAFDDASLLSPKSYSIRVLQGNLLQELGEGQKAIDAYDKALEVGLGEKDYNVWWKKAQILVKIEKYLEAVDCYKNALSLLPPPPDDYVISSQYGNTLKRLEYFHESIQLYSTSLCLQPNYRVSSYHRKQMYKKIYSKK